MMGLLARLKPNWLGQSRICASGASSAVILGALLLPLTSCGGSAVSADTGTSNDQDNGSFSSLVHQLKMIERAPWSVAYKGIRRLEFPQQVPAVAYRESVSGNGQGGFQLSDYEMLTAHPDSRTFLKQLEQSKGFQYRYRGFRVQDAYLFQVAYQVSILSNAEIVAGVPCTRMHVDRQANAGGHHLAIDSNNHYLIDVDLETGLVLRWQEIDPFGALVAKMEFESLSYGDPGVAMHPPAFGETEIPHLSDLDVVAGFKVLRPTLLPEKFRLIRATMVADGTNDWIRQVYSDGIETILLMHKKAASITDGESSTVSTYETGDRTMIVGTVEGVQLMAEGRLSPQGMKELVSSCFRR